ncbi:unnamed protein product [Ectocarpus fasciculatus]
MMSLEFVVRRLLSTVWGVKTMPLSCAVHHTCLTDRCRIVPKRRGITRRTLPNTLAMVVIPENTRKKLQIICSLNRFGNVLGGGHYRRLLRLPCVVPSCVS